MTCREDPTDVERQAQMFEKLDSRDNEVRAELIQQASGWSPRRLSTVELFVLNQDFWNGCEYEYVEAERVVREQLILGHWRWEDELDGNVSLQSGGGAAGQLVKGLSTPTSTAGATLHVILAVALGIRSKLLWDWYTEDDEEEVESSDILDEETLEQGRAERQLLDDISEPQKTVTVPAAIGWETQAAQVDGQCTTMLYLADYPDYPTDGYLSDLFEMTDVRFDLTAHITPKNQERARNEL